MRLRLLTPLLVVLASSGLPGLGPTPAQAQDAFGAAVALPSVDEAVILKPGAVRGPSMALVYRASDGWSRAARLPALAGGFPGETLTPTLAWGGDLLLLGSGDPAGAVAGHLYRRSAGGGWTPGGRVPVDPAVGVPGGLPAAGLDMATLMALMGPPARTAALSPDGSLLAVGGGALPRGTVHLLRPTADGWALEAVLVEPEGPLDAELAAPEREPGTEDSRLEADALAAVPSGFGMALAVDAGRVLVGAPEAGPGGAAYLYERGEGGWGLAATLRADSTEADGRLGAALALAGGEALVGAPEGGRVVRLAPDGSGGWERVGALAPAAPDGNDDAARAAFGASLAVSGGRLLVGAPRAEGRRGVVHVYRRDGGGWLREGGLAPGDRDSGALFGYALALRGDRALVGAPGADGGRGRAGLFDLGAGTPPVWLDPGTELTAVTGAEPVRCDGGDAAGFSCDGVDLLSFLPLSALGAGPGERVSDVWGWADPETGREYALVGRTAGMAVVDVTDPGAPRFVGLLPGNPSSARDIKTYADHAFLVGDGAGDHGLLVFDLTRLRDVGRTPVTFEPDARYDLVASAHNLVVDTEAGFAYTVGTNTGGRSCGGGLHMIDIRDPLQPTFAGCYTDTEGLIWAGRTHDAQCTVYRGPDEAYRGRQICFASNETALRIVDVTDKEAPRPIAAVSHPGTAYIHQGWLTEDQRYLYVNDELDEIVGTAERTRTLIWDVEELDDPILVGEHLGPDRATDHNLYIEGDRAYLANYQAGFRVLDVSDPEHPVEVGWFDTTPYGENPPGFLGGAWTAWPFLESGTVLVTSQDEGLFLLRPRPVVLP